MDFNQLLLYVSEKGSGTWRDFKLACEWLRSREEDPPEAPPIAARILSALGHAEFEWGEEITWCAGPPVITMLPRSGGRALLAGARTRYLLKELDNRAEEHDVWVETCAQAGAPDAIYVATDHEKKIE